MQRVRRLTRWVSVIAADLSLLLCVCSVVFWVRSYWVQDMVQLTEGWWFASGPGQVDYHSRQTVAECCLGEFALNQEHAFSAGLAASKVRLLIPGMNFHFQNITPPKASPRAVGIT